MGKLSVFTVREGKKGKRLLILAVGVRSWRRKNFRGFRVKAEDPRVSSMVREPPPHEDPVGRKGIRRKRFSRPSLDGPRGTGGGNRIIGTEGDQEFS